MSGSFPLWDDGGSWRVNHFYRTEIIYDFHKGESVWFLSHFRIKFIFCKPRAPCALLWWQWVTNNGNNAHLYTGVYCETALQSGGSPQIDLEPLPACGADQSPHKAFVENQSAQVQRKTLFRFERLDTQSEIRDCGNRLACCIDLPGKASQCITHTKTNTQRQSHMIKLKRTDRNTHTRQRELIYRMHTFHSQLYTRSNINKQTRSNAKHMP